MKRFFSVGRLSLLAALAIATSRQATADVLDGSLVARYEFTDGGALLADTAPGNTAVHDGAGTSLEWLASVGSRSGVARFTANQVGANGSQFAVAAHSDLNSTSGAITFWMNSAGTTPPGNFGSILFDRRTAAGDVIVMTDSGLLFNQATAGFGQLTNSMTGAAPVNDGVWHHIAYVYDQAATGSVQLYVDGDLDASLNNTGAWSWPAGQQLEFGRSHDAFWKSFNGRMDDVRVYDATLTGVDIAAIMLETTPVVKAGNLVAQYGFDNGATPLDDTAPGGTVDHDGVNNGVIWESSFQGRDGVARFLSQPAASSQFTVASHADFSSTAGSIAFWVKSGPNAGPGNDGAILFDRRASNGDVIVLSNDGKLFVQATETGQGLRNSFFSNGEINDDQWHHVVYVFDQSADGATQLYIDGQFDAANANTGSWSWPNLQLEFGRSHDAYWRAFNGDMDDVRYYNRPLSPEEVSSVYASTVPEPSGWLIASLGGITFLAVRRLRIPAKP